MPPPADNELNRPVAIPKFDGVAPTHQSGQNWMDGTTLYWGTRLVALTKAQLEGYLAFAFKDKALFWYQTEHNHNEDITKDWNTFVEAFKDQWLLKDIPRATIAGMIRTLRMENNEEVRHFRSRCLQTARQSTKPFTAPDEESDADKAKRRGYHTQAVEDNAMWFFVGGLLPVLRKPLLEKQFTNLKDCLNLTHQIVGTLVDAGLYKDPTMSTPSRSAAQAIQQPANLDPIASAISAGQPSLQQQLESLDPSLATQLVQSISKRFQKKKKNQQQRKTKPVAAASATPTADSGKSRERRFDPSKYTEGATCDYCGILHHTAAQCMSKANATSNSASAIDCSNDYDRFATNEDFWL